MNFLTMFSISQIYTWL